MALATETFISPATIAFAVFDGTEFVGTRRCDHLDDAEQYLDMLRLAGLRALPLSPAAQEVWTSSHPYAG
jgi:hypothetical protein